MRFEWDPEKNETNIQKHGFDFIDAHFVFSGPLLVLRDARVAYDEDRWIGLGFLKGRVVVIVFTSLMTRRFE